MLKVNNISFRYHFEKPILQKINFSLERGEHLCVMGESGCGKSTLLKVIYGLLDIYKGSIFWDGSQILGPKYHLIPGMDFFKYVAQDFDLMSFTSVSENIAHFLPRTHPEKTRKRTEELLEIIEMTPFANEKVKNLSGGQQQRVAIAKALAEEPEVILLDEPFSQIDHFKKNSLRRMLFSYLKEKNIACIVATHDSEDALSFADRMIVLQDHHIIANGPAKDLYTKPDNYYIASLFDDINEVYINDKKRLLYPHQIKIVKNSALEATVLNSYFKGFYWLTELQFNDQIIFINHHEFISRLETICLSID